MGSREDKRAAVLEALDNPSTAKMSIRAISRHCGVSHRYVSTIRRGVEPEAVVQKVFVAWLGIPVQEYVTCDLGVADVVDARWVYELKTRWCDRLRAVGQAILYGTCLNKAPCVVTTYEPPKTYEEALRRIGVALIVFQDGKAVIDTRETCWDRFIDDLLLGIM